MRLGLIVCLLGIPGAARADQIRYRGEVRNGTINTSISDEHTVYFLDRAGRNYIPYPRADIEILFCPGISDAAESLKRGRDLILVARQKSGQGEYQASVRDCQEADRCLRSIRKAATGVYAEAQAELNKLQQSIEAIRDWIKVEEHWRAGQAQLAKLPGILAESTPSVALGYLEQVEVALGHANNGPLRVKAAVDLRRVVALRHLLQRNPDIFQRAAGLAGRSLDQPELAALEQHRDALMATAQDIRRAQNEIEDGAVFFAPTTGLLQSALERVNRLIEEQRKAQQRLVTTLAELQRRMDKVHADAQSTEIEALQRTVEAYGGLRREVEELAATIYVGGRKQADAFLAEVIRGHQAVMARRVQQQESAGWMRSGNGTYYPPTLAGGLNLVQAELDAAQYEEAYRQYQLLARTFDFAAMSPTATNLLADVVYRYGVTLQSRGRLREAIRIYEMTGALFPDSALVEDAARARRVAWLLLMMPWFGGVLLGIALFGVWLWYSRTPGAVVQRSVRQLAKADRIRARQPAAAQKHYLDIIHALERLAPGGRLGAAGQATLGKAHIGRAVLLLMVGKRSESNEASRKAAEWMPVPEGKITSMLVEYYLLQPTVNEDALAAFTDYLTCPEEVVDPLVVPKVVARLEVHSQLDEQTPLEAIPERMELLFRLAAIPTAAPRVVVLEGPGRGMQYDVESRTLIGRDPDNHVLLTDPSVKSYHADIVRQGDAFMIDNAVPGAMTIVQGQNITEVRRLSDGDHIRCGNVTLAFYQRPRPPGIKPDVLYRALGIGCFRRQAYGEAIAYLECARKLKWDQVESHWYYGRAQEALQNLEAAITAYAAACDLNPTPAVQHSLGLVLLRRARGRPAGDGAAREQDMGQAVHLLKEAAKLAERNAAYFFDLAQAYNVAHKGKEALIAIQGALLLDPQNHEYQVFQSSLRNKPSGTAGGQDAVLRRAILKDGTGPGGTILIVDPSEMPESSLESVLTEHGFTVMIVPDAIAALQCVSQSPPILIITEIYLAGSDGLDFCRKLKAESATARIPIIVLTAKQGATVTADCLNAGADEFLQKPADPEVLLVKIKRLLQGGGGAGAQEGVVGQLRDMSFPELIQVLCAGGKSEILALKHEGREARVYIQMGEIIHCALGDIKGKRAFFEAMRWNDGEFRISPCSEFPEHTIQAPMMSLLMEGAQLGDETKPPAATSKKG